MPFDRLEIEPTYDADFPRRRFVVDSHTEQLFEDKWARTGQPVT
jgi:hypothetical protein